jgi:hypothetical protein
MAFPKDPLPLVSQLLIDGVWTDISRVGSVGRVGHGASDVVSISRGRRDIAGTVPPTQCDFTLNNRDGLFTNDNPNSPYYRKLPRLTQVRHYIDDSSLAGYMQFSGGSTDWLRTADAAPLDVTGDLDLRIEIDPFTWNMRDAISNDATADYFALAMKLVDGSTGISWYWAMQGNGRQYFFWTTGGTLATSFVRGSSVMTLPTSRTALRVTLDVDNGAGGWTLSFYQSTSIDGTWTLVSSTSGTGVTSIYSGAGPISIGGREGRYVNHRNFGGRMYTFQMRNGIGGTLVANADIRQRMPETNSFLDGLGNTWIPNGNVQILTDKVRFHGALEAMPQEWDSTGKDCWVPVHAADTLQRLGNDGEATQSAISQYLERYSSSITGHWPLEDGQETTTPSSAVSGVLPAQATKFGFTTARDLPGSDGYATAGGVGSFMRGAPRVTSPNGTTTALFWAKTNSPLPDPPNSGANLISFTVAGSNVKWWRIELSGEYVVQVRAFAPDGSELFNYSALSYPAGGAQGDVRWNRWTVFAFSLRQVGGNIEINLSWSNGTDGSTAGYTQTLAGTVGRFDGFTITSDTFTPDTSFAHMTLLNTFLSVTASELIASSNAWRGELAATRFLRVCASAGINAVVDGWPQDTQALGPQPIDTVLNILRDLEKTDGGILSGTRSTQGLTYTTRDRISRQLPGGSFSHAASHFSDPPKPVPDSFGIANYYTATRRDGGGSATSIKTDGPLGTGAIGTVTGGDTFNVLTLNDALSAASWAVALGTYDSPRYPSAPFQLERTATLLGSSLAAQIASLDAGRRFVIADLPVHQPPGPVDLIVQGYTEVLGNRTMALDFSSTAYGPWETGQLEGVAGPVRFAASDTTILPVTASETVLTLITPGSTSIIREPGTFETAAGVTGWTGTNGTIARSSAFANSGTYSLELTATGGFTTAYARQGSAGVARVSAGVSYRAQLLAYAPVAIGSFVVSIDWYNSSLVYLSTSVSSTVSLSAGVWTYVQATATAPAGAVFAAYGPTIAGSPAAGTKVYADDVYMAPVDRPRSARWITTNEAPTAFPFTITLAGEDMSVTAIRGRGEVQSATVIRSVNGVNKAQVLGEKAQLKRVTTFGR